MRYNEGDDTQSTTRITRSLSTTTTSSTTSATTTTNNYFYYYYYILLAADEINNATDKHSTVGSCRYREIERYGYGDIIITNHHYRHRHFSYLIAYWLFLYKIEYSTSTTEHVVYDVVIDR